MVQYLTPRLFRGVFGNKKPVEPQYLLSRRCEDASHYRVVVEKGDGGASRIMIGKGESDIDPLSGPKTPRF